MSIRLRLTLLYTIILTLTLFIFGAALYTLQSQSMMASLKKDLKMSSDNLRNMLIRDVTNPDSQVMHPEPPPAMPIEALSQDQTFKRVRERDIVRILDANGVMVASPLGGDEEALPLSTEGFNTLQNFQEWWEIGSSDDERLLIYNEPVVSDGELHYIVQVARSLQEQDRSLAALSRTLFIAGLVTVFVAFGIGWILSGYTLQPIHRITQTARMIGDESDFSKRVDYIGPNDEIGQLATTFNSMLTRLEDAYQRVSDALSMQREFVADVSHELRTPLTTVRGNLGLLLHEPPLPKDERDDILTDVVEESDRMIRLVNDLLLLARADSRRNLVVEPVSIRSIISDTCRLSRQVGPQREILEDTGDIMAMGDRDAVKQILLILVDNALKHSQGKITVSAVEAGTQVQICVHDDGPGIAPEALEHIFDRFHRGNVTTPGFGLGLPIARSLVEGQGGSITIQSKVGSGSSALVYLPLYEQ